MKKIFAVVFMLLVLVSGAMAAGETGEGTCAVLPTSGYVCQTAGSLTFTATVKTHNMVNGVWLFKFDKTFAKNFGTITLAGTATEAKRYTKWSDDTITYVQITATANIDQTILMYIPYATLPDTAGIQTFTVLTATDSKDRSTAASIASNPTLTLDSVIGYTSDSPVDMILNTYTGTMSLELNVNQTLVNGWFQIDRPNSTWAAFSAATATPGYVAITGPITIATPYVINSGASIIVSVPTMAVNQKITVTWPDRESATPAVPLKSTYGIEQQFVVKSMNGGPAATAVINAISTFTARSPIPTATGTPKVGRFDVWVATPTMVIANAGQGWGYCKVTMNSVDRTAMTQIQLALTPYISALKGATQTSLNLPIGKNSIRAIQSFFDYSNDGVYRTVTSNALTVYNVGKLDVDRMKAQAEIGGFIVTETISATANTNYSAVTCYADDRLLIRAAMVGPTGTEYGLYVGGTALGGGTGLEFVSAAAYETATIIPVGGYELIPAGSFIKVSVVAAAANDAKIFNINTIKLSDLVKIGDEK